MNDVVVPSPSPRSSPDLGSFQQVLLAALKVCGALSSLTSNPVPGEIILGLEKVASDPEAIQLLVSLVQMVQNGKTADLKKKFQQ